MDVFSYGVLLWELVTKELPQRGQLRDVRVPEECVPHVGIDFIEMLWGIWLFASRAQPCLVHMYSGTGSN